MHAWNTGLASKRYSYLELQKKLDIILKYACYDVKVKTPRGIGKIRIDDTKIRIEYDNDGGLENLIKSVRFWGNDFKLILHNLSDLTKEIEHNGEKFVPSEKINLLNGDYQLTDFIIDMNDYCVEYRHLIKLFEWHFDCFGLLYKGLAVDINTLNGTK